jgi:hypothetical protein
MFILEIHVAQKITVPQKFRNVACEMIAWEEQCREIGKQAQLWRNASLKIVVAKNNTLKR